MTELQSTVLLIGESQKNLNEYANGLREFRVRIEKNSENAFNHISEVKIAVFHLSKSSLAGDLALLQRVSHDNLSHLSWIFVGELDSNAFQTAVKQLQSQKIRRWRYLKTPLFAKELSLHIHSLLEEEISADRSHRENVFKEVKETLGGVAHEFANFSMRVMGYADLAKSAEDSEKARSYFVKLSEVCDSTGELIAKIRDFRKKEFHLSVLKPSRCLAEAVRSVGALADRKKVGFALDLFPDEEMILDATLIFSAAHDLLSWMVESASEGGKIEIRTRWRNEKGIPGMEISVSCDGNEVSRSSAEQAFRFGYDLRLPIARQLVKVHGGWLDLLPGARPEVLIWLPARLCEKT